jgi:hypothetical protein
LHLQAGDLMRPARGDVRRRFDDALGIDALEVVRPAD